MEQHGQSTLKIRERWQMFGVTWSSELYTA